MAKLTKEQKRKKAEELSNSCLLEPFGIADHPPVKALLKHIFSEMEARHLTNKRYANRLKDHIRAIALNLYVAFRNDPSRYVVYSRNSNDYRKGSRLGDLFFTYKQTIKVVDLLIKLGYIEHEPGYPEGDGFEGKLPRMRATEDLIRLIEGYEVTLPMIKGPDEEEPLLILKDENKRKIDDYLDDEVTLQMKENVKLINRNLEKHAILLYVKDREHSTLNKRLGKSSDKMPIDYTKKRLHRVFNNGSFKKGGRFYGGWWQYIPKEYREYIRINDKDTVELDYSGLHINMLYAKEGLPVPEDDVYALEGYSNDSVFRSFVKRMLLVMVNSTDRQATRAALHKEVHYEKTLKLPTEIKSVSSGHLYPLMEAFEEKHRGIKRYLNTGKGIDLQFLDSELAEKIMLHFSNMGYAILPVHDSFILHHALEEELYEAMNKAFYEMFRQSIKIGAKYRSIEQRQKRDKDKRQHEGRGAVWYKRIRTMLQELGRPLGLINPTLKRELSEVFFDQTIETNTDYKNLVRHVLKNIEIQTCSKIGEVALRLIEEAGGDGMKEIMSLSQAYKDIKRGMENPSILDDLCITPLDELFAMQAEYSIYHKFLDEHRKHPKETSNSHNFNTLRI